MVVGGFNSQELLISRLGPGGSVIFFGCKNVVLPKTFIHNSNETYKKLLRMQMFDRRSSLFIVLCCLPLLFFPKINIIRLGDGETAGLRIDDFFLLFFSFIILWAHLIVRKGLLQIEATIVALVGFSLLSYISNRVLVSLEVLHLDAKIFYCVRILEYFLFFYVGAMATRFFRIESIIKAFFVWNLLLMVLQKFGAIGEFNSLTGYNVDGSARVSGIASFPSEMGALLNLMFCFLLFSPVEIGKNGSGVWSQWVRRTYIYWLFLLFGVLVIMTGSRVAIVALVVPFLFKLRDELNLKSASSFIRVGVFLVCAVVAIAFVVTQTESIVERSKGLLSWKNVDLAGDVWDKVNIEIKLDDNPGNVVAYEGQDLSWWIRIHKWIYFFKTYLLHPECYLQGLGPGSAGAALDGGFLRILIEYGGIGCILFWKFFGSIYRKTPQLQWMCIGLFFNMIFFDAYLAYKPMSLLFLITGYVYARCCIHPHQVTTNHCELSCSRSARTSFPLHHYREN